MMTYCEGCGAERVCGIGESTRYRCGSYRIGNSSLVQMRGCLDNQLSRLRQFENRVRQADKLHTIQAVAFEIRNICRE
jgi:hypothetical protein